MPLLAIAGAFCTTAFLYAYSWRKGIRPIRFLLTGVGVNAGITAVISFYQLQMSRGDYNQVLMWTNGSLWGSSWRYILVSAPLILFLAGLVWTHSRTLDILSLGDEGATALGVSTRRTRILFLAAGAALAALATAVAGNIAFLGLLVPRLHCVSPVCGIAAASACSTDQLHTAGCCGYAGQKSVFTAGDSGRNSGLHDRHSLFYLSDDETRQEVAQC